MKKLYLAGKGDRKLLGVCAGIAEAHNIDPTMVRVATIAVGFLFIVIPMMLIYLVLLYLGAWALIPPKPED